ncbi:MAG: CNNM domain-containing protein [Mariprofundaceae bacterium]|nr:CNNM domain-containing protein [Mariprofundaceae bacterium]
MDEIGISLPAAVGILIFLLLLSAFFSGSETALTRARRVRLKVLSEQGNSGARQAKMLLKKPEQMLSTILLGNNFVNIAATSLATVIFVSAFGDAGVLYATITMTTVVLVFSEILPKTIAVAHPESIACRVATPLKWIQKISSPIIWLLMHFITGFQRILKVPEKQDVGFNHKELASMIDMSAETGMLDSAREQMLMSSLRLHEVTVKSLMTPRKDMVMLDAAETVGECRQSAVKNPHSRYPVFFEKSDNILGIVHLRELFKLKEMNTRMTHAMIWVDPPYAPANRNALTQLFEFQSKHQHMAIVVDEFGDIDGLITLEDIIEEIVGEIVDESDIPSLPEVWPQPDGSLVVAGTANLHDLNLALDTQMPEENATTIGGLIVRLLGDQPEEKLCILESGVYIEVTSLHGDWIRRVKLTKANESGSPHDKSES